VTEDRVIVGTETGELLLIEQFECKPQPLLQSPMDGNPLNCVIVKSQGFICAGDGGAIHIFERVRSRSRTRPRPSLSRPRPPTFTH
jgi:hypothetical protein